MGGSEAPFLQLPAVPEQRGSFLWHPILAATPSSLFLCSRSETPSLPGPGAFDMDKAGRSEPLQAQDTALVWG